MKLTLNVGSRLFNSVFSDRVFDEACVTLDIFDDICKPIVDAAVGGFNGNYLPCSVGLQGLK